MLAVKGIYKQGEIKLLEPLEGIDEAELYIVVIPYKLSSQNAIIMDDGKIYPYDNWSEEEMNYMGEYSLMKDSDDSPEVIFDED